MNNILSTLLALAFTLAIAAPAHATNKVAPGDYEVIIKETAKKRKPATPLPNRFPISRAHRRKLAPRDLPSPSGLFDKKRK